MDDAPEHGDSARVVDEPVDEPGEIDHSDGLPTLDRLLRRPHRVPPWHGVVTWLRAADRRLLIGIGSAVVVAAVVIGVMASRSGAAATAQVTLPRARSDDSSSTGASSDDGQSGGATSGPTGSSPGAVTSTTAGGPIVVDLVGAVLRPGLVSVRGGARVADAVAAAGGFRPDADADRLNLAAPVADGARIYVPAVGQSSIPVAVGASGGTAGGGADGAGVTTIPAPVDLNSATADQLDTLPGVGPSTALAILSYRTAHGSFASVDDLDQVRNRPGKAFTASRPGHGRMTDRDTILMALAAAIMAGVAPGVPWWMVLVFGVVALVIRRPSLVALAIVLLVAARSHDAIAGLAGARAGSVSGSITVLSDPIVRYGSWQFDARRGDEHDAVEVPHMMMGPPVVGERLVVHGMVSPLHAEGGLLARHLRSRLVVTAVSGRSPPDIPLRAANAVRNLLVRGTTSLDSDRALFSGLVLGDDRAQTPLLTHQFRASGLAHLLAVSGQNVAFVLVAASPLLARGSLRWRWAITILVLAGFTLVTRWEPSVLRAVVMAGIAATAHLRGRHTSGLRRAGVAIVLLLIADPLLVWSSGFQLSVAATIALVVLQRPIARSLPGPRWLIDPLATVLAAQAGTAPLLLAMGATLSVASLPANLLAVPVAGWVMVWGLTAGFVAGVAGGGVAGLIHRPTAAMLWWIRSVAGWAASSRWPAVGAVALGLIAVALALRWVIESPAVRAAVWVPAVAVVAVGAWSLPAGRWSDVRGATVWRADGVVVVTSGGATDAGRLLDELTRLRVARIDVLVLTGTGSGTSALADTVRHGVDVAQVMAGDGLVRGAHPLAAGEVRAGSIRVRLSQVDGRWRVAGPGVG